jgi:hypothetical protein
MYAQFETDLLSCASRALGQPNRRRQGATSFASDSHSFQVETNDPSLGTSGVKEVRLLESPDPQEVLPHLLCLGALLNGLVVA